MNDNEILFDGIIENSYDPIAEIYKSMPKTSLNIDFVNTEEFNGALAEKYFNIIGESDAS